MDILNIMFLVILVASLMLSWVVCTIWDKKDLRDAKLAEIAAEKDARKSRRERRRKFAQFSAQADLSKPYQAPKVTDINVGKIIRAARKG